MTAVSKPKVFCTNDTSLSMVFGMPMTATGKISKKDLRAKYKDTLVEKEQAAS